jgi:SlyX protein
LNGRFARHELLAPSFPKIFSQRNAKSSRLPAFAWQIIFMADENSRRIEKIESHVAHLEHQVEQLNGVVIEQGKLLEHLKKEAQRQSSAMETLELERIKSNNARPPHH